MHPACRWQQPVRRRVPLTLHSSALATGTTSTPRGVRRPAARRATQVPAARRRARRRSVSPPSFAGCLRTAGGRRRPSWFGTEVEQPPGNDVALDLEAAAVDRRGAWVEIVGAPLR